MNEELRQKLEKEISDSLDEIANLGIGTEEYKKALHNFSELHNLKLEEDKLLVDKQDKCEQINGNSLDRKIRIGIVAAELLVPIIFYSIWMKRGFEFEKEGTYTSTTFRGLFNRFKPTMK